MDFKWLGKRGEGYLAIQLLLFLLIAFGPRALPGLPSWQVTAFSISRIIGIGFGLVGIALAFGGLLNLGPNLSPLPYPKDESVLVQEGIYEIVRHPIYSGLILMVVGWGLARGSSVVLAYALLLFLFFEVKSRREEAWLAEKFADYGAYQQRVKKLIPFLY